MIRKRRFTPALRRRLADLDERPGISADQLWEQAHAAARRMHVIDAQAQGWRDLLNDYPHQCVAEAAERLGTPQAVRYEMERKLGKAI